MAYLQMKYLGANILNAPLTKELFINTKEYLFTLVQERFIHYITIVIYLDKLQLIYNNIIKVVDYNFLNRDYRQI